MQANQKAKYERPEIVELGGLTEMTLGRPSGNRRDWCARRRVRTS